MFRSMVAGIVLVAGLQSADAADYQVHMINQGAGGMMQFDPQLVKIAPGDTVHFIATDGGHNVQSVDGMIPAGAKPFSGVVGKDLTVTFSVPGVYGYRCTPHGTLGMVGLVFVGTAVNEDQAKAAAMPGLAGRVFAKLFEALDTQRTASVSR